MNLKFKRQFPLYNYIADFYCHELKLIVEVDGGYHTEKEQILKDEERSMFLNVKGLNIFRMTNEEVYNIDVSLNNLKTFIGTLKAPSPSGEGGGEVYA